MPRKRGYGNYLVKSPRSTVFHVRYVVPPSQRGDAGVAEFRRTLRTSNLDEARLRALQMVHALKSALASRPLSLTIKKLLTQPDGTVQAEGVELDPQNIEADTRALKALLDGGKTSAPAPAQLSLRPKFDRSF